MPGVASWNGRWSGEGKLYAVVRKVSDKKAAEILVKPYYSYGWSDGWRAAINVKKCEGHETRIIRKRSSGFCGYEWMIDSILVRGKILADHEIPKEEKPVVPPIPKPDLVAMVAIMNSGDLPF